ncbi:MAG: MBL fold metallo-hydrolase [Patescibacteria group bacterium]
MSALTVRFWGVRGSVPSPITNAAIEEKMVEVARKAIVKFKIRDGHVPDEEVLEWMRSSIPFRDRATYGGNTTCVEVRVGGELIILDMGTGLRELGLSLMGETRKYGGLKGTILQSHVHWDHIQGYPFWPQLYIPRTAVQNEFMFYGGREWDKSLEEVLRGQMNPPVFPVDHRELEMTSLKMNFDTVYDGKKIIISQLPEADRVRVTCRKLNHPQETYGYRIEHRGKVLAFCTDHEPYAGNEPPRGLLELAKDADVFITDCQYSHDEYAGVGGKVQKHGWGHSYPEYIAKVADMAKVKKVVTTHHDPQASDARIEEIAEAVEKMSGITTVPAYEGLIIGC